MLIEVLKQKNSHKLAKKKRHSQQAVSGEVEKKQLEKHANSPVGQQFFTSVVVGDLDHEIQQVV